MWRLLCDLELRHNAMRHWYTAVLHWSDMKWTWRRVLQPSVFDVLIAFLSAVCVGFVFGGMQLYLLWYAYQLKIYIYILWLVCEAAAVNGAGSWWWLLSTSNRCLSVWIVLPFSCKCWQWLQNVNVYFYFRWIFSYAVTLWNELCYSFVEKTY